ncbi:hypothetical protein Tco_0594674 [Tanacetum coccineum]
MLKKFGLEDSKPTKMLMSTEIKLTKDDEADSVDISKYQGMIGSLLYLTASRPDIMFSVCLCARFQENPKTTDLEAVKRIFRYIRGTSHLGLWYPKGTRTETIVYADSYHAGDYVDRKSTSGVCTKMPSEYQQDYKKIRAYAPKIYNDPNMSDTLRYIYRTLESRYVHEGRTIDPSFYNDLSDDSVAKFTAIGFECLLSLNEQICPRFIFHEHVMDPLDISRNPSKEKGKKIASPSVISSSSSSSDDNEAPSFLEFYDELSDSEDLRQRSATRK